MKKFLILLLLAYTTNIVCICIGHRHKVINKTQETIQVKLNLQARKDITITLKPGQSKRKCVAGYCLLDIETWIESKDNTKTSYQRIVNDWTDSESELREEQRGNNLKDFSNWACKSHTVTIRPNRETFHPEKNLINHTLILN